VGQGRLWSVGGFDYGLAAAAARSVAGSETKTEVESNAVA
jgi:hypothetical protein